jgi:hypothetical protein
MLAFYLLVKSVMPIDFPPNFYPFFSEGDHDSGVDESTQAKVQYNLLRFLCSKYIPFLLLICNMLIFSLLGVQEPVTKTGSIQKSSSRTGVANTKRISSSPTSPSKGPVTGASSSMLTHYKFFRLGIFTLRNSFRCLVEL